MKFSLRQFAVFAAVARQESVSRAAEALSYNGLVQSWPEITRLAREEREPASAQAGLFDF